jgi:hypothetical protein
VKVKAAPGVRFSILLGNPRDCIITRVTKARIYYTSGEGESTIPYVSGRDLLDNAALIKVHNTEGAS